MPIATPETAPVAARYTNVAIVLHWAIGILLLFEIGLGLRMEDATGSARFATFQLHKSIGITILLLIALRLVWRWRNTPPPLVHGGWERTLAHAVHVLFYVLLFALPLSGWLIVSSSRIVVPTLLYGTIPWPHLPGFATMAGGTRDAWNGAAKFLHHSGIYLIYALFALHLAGVIKHQFVDRDRDLARMAPGIAPGVWRDWRVVAIAAGIVLALGLGLQWLPLGSKARAAPVAEVPVAPPTVPQPAPDPVANVATPVADNASEPAAANSTEAVANASPVWRIAAGSSLRFVTQWSGDAVNGSFTRFDGDISFDPAHLDAARVEIRIPVATASTGDAQRDETLRSSDWFSAAAFGTAVFRAKRFRHVDGDRYVASGTLTIKGTTLPTTLPFTLKITGDKADMRGTATVDRIAYKIGEGDYAGTGEIPAAVRVEVAVRATRGD